MRRKFRNHHSRKSRRLTYTVEDKVTDAECQVTGTARVGEGSAKVSDDLDHQQFRECTDCKDFSGLPAATPPHPRRSHHESASSLIPPLWTMAKTLLPQYKSSSPAPTLIHHSSSWAPTPSQPAPHVRLSTRAKFHVGFQSNHAEPDDHVEGKILVSFLPPSFCYVGECASTRHLAKEKSQRRQWCRSGACCSWRAIRNR